MFLDFHLLELAENNDIGAIKTIIRKGEYQFNNGLMTIAYSLNKGKNDIAYELLSIDGAWDHYVKTRFSPFVVMDKLREAVRKYKYCNGCQNCSR